MRARKVVSSSFPHRSSPEKKPASAICPVETGGEFLPDGTSITLIQTVEADRLQLVFGNGNSASIVANVEYSRRIYGPPKISESFREAIIFPAGMRDFGSTTALFTGITDSLMRHGMPGEVAQSATYFGFSSWFTEVLPAAPLLLISSPRPEATLLLQLIGCFVRHP